MLAAPHLVGGTGRLDTDVMTAGAGRVIAKEGAEGLVCATSLGQGLGIALKVTDGNWRRLAPDDPGARTSAASERSNPHG